MALIDIKTNLKSLKFGQDRPGGGSSGQPYIQVDINNPTRIFGNRTLDALTLGTTAVAKATAIDTLRIGKFFLDAPKGPMFLASQVGLQLSNPKLESRLIRPIETVSNKTKIGRVLNDGISILNKGVDVLNDAGIGSTRVYNLGVNTLKQVAVSGFGGHIVRHGFNSSINADDTYEYVVRRNNEEDSNKNRLVALKTRIIDNGENIISEYIGGPDSVFGIGSTVIKRYDDTNSKLVDNPKFNILANKPTKYSTRYTRNEVSYTSGLPKLDANGQEIPGTIQTINIKGTWAGVNREARIGSGRADSINLTPIFNSNNPPGTSVKINGINHNVRDLIKFRIEAINSLNHLNSDWMVFRAYITNFRDNYNGDWSDIQYSGRGERFHIQRGFSRGVGLNFKVAALSAGEMKPMYQKLNYLASNVMPDYTGENQLMKGSLMKLTVGNYLYRQMGFIASLEYSISNETPWEIAIDSPEGGDGVEMYELPHIIDVSMTFVPIHDFLPQKSASNPLIIDKETTQTPSSHWLREADKTTPLQIQKGI